MTTYANTILAETTADNRFTGRTVTVDIPNTNGRGFSNEQLYRLNQEGQAAFGDHDFAVFNGGGYYVRNGQFYSGSGGEPYTARPPSATDPL